jgi:hypothetical protein
MYMSRLLATFSRLSFPLWSHLQQLSRVRSHEMSSQVATYLWNAATSVTGLGAATIENAASWIAGSGNGGLDERSWEMSRACAPGFEPSVLLQNCRTI